MPAPSILDRSVSGLPQSQKDRKKRKVYPLEWQQSKGVSLLKQYLSRVYCIKSVDIPVVSRWIRDGICLVVVHWSFRICADGPVASIADPTHTRCHRWHPGATSRS